MDTPGQKMPPVMTAPTHRAGSSHVRQTTIVSQLASDRAHRIMARDGGLNTGNAPVLTSRGIIRNLFSR